MKYILNTFRRDESDDIIISKLRQTKNSSIQRKKKKKNEIKNYFRSNIISIQQQTPPFE